MRGWRGESDDEPTVSYDSSCISCHLVCGGTPGAREPNKILSGARLWSRESAPDVGAAFQSLGGAQCGRDTIFIDYSALAWLAQTLRFLAAPANAVDYRLRGND